VGAVLYLVTRDWLVAILVALPWLIVVPSKGMLPWRLRDRAILILSILLAIEGAVIAYLIGRCHELSLLLRAVGR
jgi:hypothetical protein